MDDLFLEVRKNKNLEKAWKHVKKSGLASNSDEIKDEVKQFEAKAIPNLRRIYDQLRIDKFRFLPQKGFGKPRPGKHPRPIVIAPVENRIVQRAILEVLRSNVPAVAEILKIPTSVGGIKGVEDAIKQVTNSIKNGAKWFIRSDIHDFFSKIPKHRVINFLKNEITDPKFLNLFEQAIETVLENASSLGDEVELFPIEDTGVAQGSALSPLIGNILLKDFDIQMNDRGISCIRYIDDFIILAPTRKKSLSAFKATKLLLSDLGLLAYDPLKYPEKAIFGEIDKGFDFLGCNIKNLTVVPSRKSRQSLLVKIDRILSTSIFSLRHPSKIKNRKIPKHGYGQTISKVSRTLKGWDDAYKFCKNRTVSNKINISIDKLLIKYENNISLLRQNSPSTEKKTYYWSLFSLNFFYKEYFIFSNIQEVYFSKRK